MGCRIVIARRSCRARCRGAAITAFNHFVQWQVQQVALAVFVAGHEYFAGIAEDFLHGVQVQAVTRHIRSLAILAHQFGKAVCLTLGARNHFITIAIGVFDDALGLTGLILTKLDGTAKGGVIAAIAKQRPIPLRFVGVGESIDDLRPFNSKDYVDALFD